MAKHLVKCLYCNQTFDANSEPFVKPRANRYAHKACYEEHQSAKSQEERDYEILVDYIKHLFGNKPNPRVWKQLKEYAGQGYTYSGIYRTLVWWFELRHNDIEKANGGIGIVPFVYEQASQYYYALHLAQIANESKDLTHYKENVCEFWIDPPKAQPRKKRLMKFAEEEESK